jgi:hypothetical protein
MKSIIKFSTIVALADFMNTNILLTKEEVGASYPKMTKLFSEKKSQNSCPLR